MWVVASSLVLVSLVAAVRGLIAEPGLAEASSLEANAADVAAMDPASPAKLIHDEDRNEFVILHGPVDLPASDAGMHEAHTAHDAVFPDVSEVIVPFDASVFAFYVDLVDRNGEPLPSDLLHHVNLVDPDRRELFAPISLRMSAAGKETGYKSVPPRLMGMPLERGQRLVIHTMLHNSTGEDIQDAVLRYHLRLIPEDHSGPMLSVYPFWVDVQLPAGDKTFDLPPGRSSKSYEARPAIPGRILALSGHAHQFAQRLVFEDVTTGDVVWETVPELGEDGDVENVPIGHEYLHLGTPLDPDHVYRLTVEYDNPTGATLPDGGMGSIGGVFLPDGGAEWPAVDPTEELYQLDLKHYYRELLGKLPDLRRALADSADGVMAPDGHAHSH